MRRGKKAWSMLQSLGATIQVQSRRGGINERKTVYNPYKKRYDVRTTTPRRSQKEELQMILQENEYPTDHIWIGDKMKEEREKGVIRMWVQNWNGAERNDIEMMKYQLSMLVDNNINYFSIIESKLNQYHKVTKNKWDTAKESIMPQGELCITSTPGYPIEKSYQPGGIISGFHGRLRSRLSLTKRDPLGRWHYHQFYGKKRDLRVYSIYRVNNGQKESKGDTTAWTQQKNLLDLANDERNPRKAVIEDFLIEIKAAVAKEYSIIIMGDLNETIGGSEKTNEKLGELGLINLMEEYVGDTALPRTCTKGSNAIDHIWITGNILPAVQSAGFAPFQFIKNSDHRGLYFDFYYKDILDDDLFHLETYSKKRLKSTIPSRVEKYMEIIKTKWDENRFEARYHKISKSFKEHGKTEENINALNILDRQITEVMIQAEKKCSKVPTCKLYAWSTKLKEAMRNLVQATTARTQARKIKTGDNIEEAIRNFQKKDEEWKKMKVECKEIKKKNKLERTTHLDECAAKNVENDPTLKLAQEIRRLKHIESQREQAVRMKYVLKPFSKQGVTTIQIPAVVEYSRTKQNEENFDHYDVNTIWERILPHNGNDIVHWERVTDKIVVQKLLLEWQRKHFTQANETPLASTQWNDILCNKEKQSQILEGKFQVPEDMPEEVKEIFAAMKRPDCISQEIAYKSTINEFLVFINGASEKTSTSPSGRGYNHYKSMVKGGGMQQIKLIHDILELARTNGIVLNRWKKTVTTLMEKDVGRPRIHRMRALHIIEAEVQFLAKLFYCKKLMHNAEKYDLITNQQHGGRKDKQAQTAVINKLLYYNIAHQQVMNAAFIDDDARNCYDRIITALSAVEMRSWGQSFEEAEFSVNFLQQQEYHIRTGLGITNESYTYNRTEPTQGSGQGIGWAGVKFTRTSDTISKVMENTCTGMQYSDPENKYTVNRNADFFVDDTALGVARKNMTAAEVLSHLQSDQQKHAYLLFATGHKLALDKCHYYWVSFKRDGVKHRHKLIHELPGELKIRPGYNMQEDIIPRFQPFQSHKTLGCHISADMNQKGQIRSLRKKIQAWCKKMQTSYLKEQDMQYAYSGYIKMAIQYILSTTSMTYDECNSLMKHMEPILLHSYRFHCNCSRTLLYMPLKYGGVGIKHIYHLQGQEKLRFLFMHIRRNDDTGKMIRIAMAWSQLEAGISTNILNAPHDEIMPFLTPTWYTHLWKYLEDCECSLHLSEMHNKLGVRQNDFFLMDIIRKANISLRHKQIFNQIRLFLQVETVADILLSNSGTQICKNIWECKRIRKSTKHWPSTQPFPSNWREIWTSILRNHVEPILQSHPLGDWIRRSHQCAVYQSNSTTNILYDGETYYEKIRARNRFVQTVDVELELRNEVIILHVQDGVEVIKIQETTQHHQTDHAVWKIRNWGTLDIDSSLVNLIGDHLQHNNIIAASDGSVLEGRSAHAFCIATKDHEILVKAAAPVDCSRENPTSFRAESFGALAVVTFLEHIAQTLNIQQKTINIYIDNEETVQTLNKKIWHNTGTVLADDRDIAIELRNTVRNASLKYVAKHVKGHMDRVTNDLSPEQWLNQQMDLHVGDFIRDPPPRLTPQTHPPLLPCQKICILHHGEPVIANVEDFLIETMMREKIEEYYTKNHAIKQHHMDVIDYLPLRQVLNKNKQKIIPRLKCINHQWHTMSTSRQWGATSDATCPMCGQEAEDWKHLFSCAYCEMKRSRTEQRKKFIDKMKKLRTLPQLLNQIVEVLDAYGTNRQPEYKASESPYCEYIKLAFDVQEEVGFSSFIVGLIVSEWGEAQNVYFRQEIKEIKYNTIRWKQGLIEALLNYATAQWKERCDLIHAENSATHEQRFRALLQIKLNYLQEHKSLIHQSDYFLLNKTDSFFQKCDKANLEMWYIRVKIAVDRQHNNMKKNVGDIRKYGTLTKRKRRCRQRVHTKSQEYKQLTLFAPTQATVTRTPITTTQITEAEQQNIQRKRRRLLHLVRKRNRQQTSILQHTKVRKKQKIRPDPSNEASIRTCYVRTAKRMSTAKHHATTLRKRMRKEGRELKNAR